MHAGLKRDATLALGAIGVLLLSTGVWLSPVLRQDYLTSAEAAIAFTPVAEIPLDRLDSAHSLSIPLVIPDSSQWRHIRHVWGEPDWIIAAIHESSIDCLSDIGISMDLARQGVDIPMENSSVPYGYAASVKHCAAYAVKFRSPPGNTIALNIRQTRSASLPPGELRIAAGWWNTKDKLVGVDLAQDFRLVVESAITLGSLLILVAVLLLFRYRFRSSST